MGIKVISPQALPTKEAVVIPSWEKQVSTNYRKKIKELEQCDYYGLNSVIAEDYIDFLTDHIMLSLRAGVNLGVSREQLVQFDFSMFGPEEFPGLALNFAPIMHKILGRELPASFDRDIALDLYAEAWAHHTRVNPHHWQYWIAHNDIVEMSEKYALEMIAEWIGSNGKLTGDWDLSKWLSRNMDTIKLHPKTVKYVREVLSDIGYAEVISDYRFENEL